MLCCEKCGKAIAKGQLCEACSGKAMGVSKPTKEELLRQDIDFLLSPKNLANSKYSTRARNVARALKDLLPPPAVGRDEVIEECIALIDCGGCKGVKRLNDGSCVRACSGDCFEEIANEMRALKTIRPSDNSD